MKHIDLDRVPKHVAIIMDGNRRWAKLHRLPTIEGHRKGSESLENVLERAGDLGVKVLTVYAFSSENLVNRTKKEIRDLMNLMRIFIVKKRKDLLKRGARIGIIGNIKVFPKDLQNAIEETKNILKHNERIKLNVALNYGGRPEIVEAIKNIMKSGVPAADINEELISQNLYTKQDSDPDLIIRTGGEHRLSNFLIWQASYSELYFTDVLWPDFGVEDFDNAVLDYQRRTRRFGK